MLALLVPAAAPAQIDSGGGIRYDTIPNTRGQARTFDTQQLRRSGSYTRQARAAETRQVQERQPATRERTWKDEGRWVLGGGIGFSWGDHEWSLQLSPQIGYRVARMLVLGGGISYGYFEGRRWDDYRSNLLGINGLAQLYPVRYIVLFAQPGVYYQWGRSHGHSVDLDPVFCLPLGVGGVIPVWRGGIMISFSYDVVQNHHSPYGDRVNCSVGYLFNW